MLATDLLKQQHREYEELTRQIESAEDDDERAALRVELADMLAAHTTIEEELFYPTALEHLGPATRIRESLEEHAVVDFALYRFVSTSVADETFSAKLATLKELVMNHVEEEESELFPQVEGEIDQHLLDELGDKMAARFDERVREGHRSILERSLGIAARQATMTAPNMPSAPAVARPSTKRKVTSKKRPIAAKRGAAAKRTSSTKQSAKQTATSKKAQPAAQRPVSSGRTTSTKGQGSSRTTSKSTSRRPVSRKPGAAKKARAVG